jgi:23S rRNA pseudouridine2457 synthase
MLKSALSLITWSSKTIGKRRAMSKLLLFNKPFQVLSQFREHENKVTLAHYIDDRSLRLAGRLDFDSEGLLMLTDDGKLAEQISDPRFKKPKVYWAQVEGVPNDQALQQLRAGVHLKDGLTRPAKAQLIDQPSKLWARTPPIRYRANIPTCWLQLTITEGKNRQVRRMTAAVGHPTLRLVRASVGDWQLGDLKPGESRWAN